jgi:hypothetical protein
MVEIRPSHDEEVADSPVASSASLTGRFCAQAHETNLDR